MVHSVKQCDRLERLERALLVIEGLYLASDLDGTPFADEVYEVAHAALGMCGNPHMDWLEHIDQLQDDLKDARIVDIDKIIEERQHGSRPIEDLLPQMH